jgi:hypothetical protein
VSEPFLGLLIESLVAVLLALTIGYCLILNRRLKRLRADESSLRATISELISATQIAERAIEGLQTTVRDCDATLGERLRTAERMSGELSRELRRGDEIITRIHRIAVAARSTDRPLPEPTAKERPAAATAPRVAETVAAAQAIADRTRLRGGQAA